MMIKNIRTTLLIFISFLVLSCQIKEKTDNALLLKNISIIDVVTGKLIPNRNILIQKNIIVSVDYHDDTNTDIETYDCSGKYLMPGLMNMHVHLFNNVSSRPPSEWAFPLFVKKGVTGIREMWTPLDSIQTIRRWRKAFDAGIVLPRILSAGGLVEGGTKPWVPNMHLVSSEAEAREFVRNTKKRGLDFVKVYSHLKPNIYQAIIDEANKLNLEVSGHIPLEVGLSKALKAGQKTNEHLWQILIASTTKEAFFLNARKQFYENSYELEDEYKLLDEQMFQVAEFYNDSICNEVAKQIANAGQWQVPTLINERRWYLGVTKDRITDSLLAMLPKSEKDIWMSNMEHGDVTYDGDSLILSYGWNAFQSIVKTLADNDVGFLAGTDFGQPFVYPGYSLHEELELLVESGLTPLQAIQSATINPAKYLQLNDSLGTVQEGKLADLVILNKNPLDNISNTQIIHAVILNGKYIQVSAY